MAFLSGLTGQTDPSDTGGALSAGFGATPTQMQVSPITNFAETPSVPAPAKSDWWHSPDRKDAFLAAAGALLNPNGNIGDGLAALAASRSKWRQDQKKATALVDPDKFVVATQDPQTGAVSYHVDPTLQAASQQKWKQEHGLKSGQVQSGVQRVLAVVGAQPPEQQSAAFAAIKANPENFGLSQDIAAALPADWNPTAGQIAGSLGLNQNQADTQARQTADSASRASDRTIRQGIAQRNSDSMIQNRQANQGFAQQRIDVSKTKGKAGVGNNAAPKTLKVGTQMGGHTYIGGDPSKQSSWK